ncbi:MAG: hypothetical protein Q4A31_08520 [Corynebacterium sp.]|uniref:hypothetical protein n=1 Tax=Corynebacterium sp. TaxID=1720 RepID=UPI0026DD3F51|nr:hypothetical protein [Corynebacterium sp.]MDO4761945.1 hypothetical protein [Corynebacterium sp.]
MKLKVYLTAFFAVFVGLLVPSYAYAEGYFETRMDRVRSGFGTRAWIDNNIDSYSTEITASGCLNDPHGSPGKVEFTLKRHIPILPDSNHGTRNLNGCYRSFDRGSWGRVVPGRYYAIVGTYDWNHLTINWLKVVY